MGDCVRRGVPPGVAPGSVPRAWTVAAAAAVAILALGASVAAQSHPSAAQLLGLRFHFT